MSRADFSSPRTTRLGVAVLVAALHVAAVLALIRAFAPEFTAAVAERLTSVLTVEVTAPAPKPPPVPERPEPAGAAAEAGKRTVPREAATPKPRIAVASPAPAPPVAGKGDDLSAGAREAGRGTGAGGPGAGTGAGAGGSGQGAGGAGKAVKIAGDINSARDYPRKSRALRLGDHVVIALTVGRDGRVKGCRIHRPSRDPDADRITCRLAIERFRFRPATDANGDPVESIYGWQQRWYAPREKD
jgi:protein TonB